MVPIDFSASLGHEATVCDVGPGVSTAAPGDHVVLTWIRTQRGMSASPATYD